MSNQDGNDQEFVHLTPENGTNAENDKQQKKMKPLTAFVQIGLAEPNNGPVKVELGQDCSTVAAQAAFLLWKINQSQGNLIGLQLNGPIALAAVSKDDVFMMKHNVPFEVDSKYIFRFKLVEVPEKKEKNVPDPVEELAKQVKQLEKRVEEQEKIVVKHQKLLEEVEAKAKLEDEQRMATAEYARLIGVPNVANLNVHYDKQKLLQLLEHGNMPSIYIQNNQQLKDPGLLQIIVDLLARAEKPAKMIGEVKIEAGEVCFTWPKREELKLKEKKPNVALTRNEASASSVNIPGKCLAEYELTSRGWRFQVLIHYWQECRFNNWVEKFIYRRLP